MKLRIYNLLNSFHVIPEISNHPHFGQQKKIDESVSQMFISPYQWFGQIQEIWAVLKASNDTSPYEAKQPIKYELPISTTRHR